MKFKVSILNFLMLAVLSLVPLRIAYSQTASILPPAKTTYLDKNGKPLAFGTVDFYIPGTTTPKTTWQDAGQTIPNTNPVVLDNAGRSLVLGDGSYRQIVKDKDGNIVWDQVTSSGNSSSGGGGTPTVGDGDAVGTVKAWAGLKAPDQYVFAYGQELVRTSYPEALAAVTSQQNVSCTIGSPTLTGLSDTAQFGNGTAIESSCLNAGATVISKTTSTVTASSNAIISTTTSARFFPFGNGDGNLTFNLPDLRGRVIAGRDNMGGISSNRLPQPYDSLGGSGGNQSYTLTQSNLPNLSLPVTIPAGQGAHSHTFTAAIFADSLNNGPYSEISVAGTGSTSVATLPQMTGTAALSGSSNSFNLTQPTQTQNYIIKVLPDSNPNTFFGVASIGGMYGVINCGVGVTCAGNTISAVNSTLSPPSSTILGGVFTVTCSSSNWVNILDNTGAFGCSQPSFADLLGTLGVSQGGTGSTSFTANDPLIGNGASPITQGTRSGNTTKFATVNGSPVNGNCLKADANGNIADAGAPCGGGGGGSSVPDIAALKAITPGTADYVYVNGYNAAGDGGQGWFTWDASNSTADNSCTIFQPSTLPATGRWVRQIPVSGQYSVGWCGLVADNTTDIGAVLQNLITNIIPASGGAIIIPAAQVAGNYYRMTTAITSKDKIKFLGAGGGEQTTGSITNVRILWAGSNSTPRLFDMRDTYNDIFDNISVQVPSTFTGVIVDIGATAVATKISFFAEIRNSSFFVEAPFGSNSVTCLLANRSVAWIVDRTAFTNCNRAIVGRSDPDTYAIQSTTGTITRNHFYLNAYALVNGGNGWAVLYNIFEGDHLGRAQAFSSGGGSGLKTTGMYFAYNWFGDVTTPGGSWFSLVSDTNNMTIENNFLAGDSGSDVIYATGSYAINGLTVQNNYIDTFAVAFYFDSGLTVNGATISGNSAKSTTYCVGGSTSGSANIIRQGNSGFTNKCEIASAGTNGYRLNYDGTLEQWGQISATAAAVNNVTFPKAFSSACYQVQVSVQGPSNAAFGAPYSQPCSTTGVVVSSMGTSGTATINWRAVGK